MRLIVALLAAGAGARAAMDRARAAIDPAHALNLTLYHVNPLSEGVIPVDMDTSRARRVPPRRVSRDGSYSARVVEDRKASRRGR